MTRVSPPQGGQTLRKDLMDPGEQQPRHGRLRDSERSKLLPQPPVHVVEARRTDLVAGVRCLFKGQRGQNPPKEEV
jgi:hypothetical protein